MIESLTCTAFQWFLSDTAPDWEALDTVIRHRCELLPNRAAVDVTYQIQFKSPAVVAAQFDTTYRVISSNLNGDTDWVQETTWPYLRMDLLSRLTPLGAGPDLLPVSNPVTSPTRVSPPSIEPTAPAPLPPKPVILPESLATELRLNAALAKLTSTGERWWQPAIHLYSAFVHLERRRSRTPQELGIVDQLFQTEAGCTLDQVVSLSPAVRKRLRNQARQLVITAIHAVMELRADTDTGHLEDTFDLRVEELFTSEEAGSTAPQTSPTVPVQIMDAAMQILELTHQEVKQYKFHSGHLFSVRTPIGSTIVTYATGYDFAVEDRIDNVGHTKHIIDLYVDGMASHDDTAIGISLREDVSEDFERWADEYNVLSQSPEDQVRLRRVRALNASPPPIPTRTLSELGTWAAGHADEDAINDALLSLPLTPADLLEAAGLPGIDMWAVVKHHSCTPEVLNVLAGHPDEEVRADVAAFSGAPPDLLVQLYQDSSRVRQSLGMNHSLPPELQLLLVHNADDQVRACVAVNPALRHELMEVLADDAFSGTRENLAQNPSIPSDLLNRLLKDPDEHVRESAHEAHAKRRQK